MDTDMEISGRKFENSKGKNRTYRRRVLVNKKIQFSHVFNLILFQLVSFGSLLVLGSWLVFFKIDGRVKIFQEPAIIKSMCIILIFVNIAALFWSLFFFRSITGPMRKVQLILRGIAKGQVPDREVKFRKKDYFKEILPDLNDALNKVRPFLK